MNILKLENKYSKEFERQEQVISKKYLNRFKSEKEFADTVFNQVSSKYILSKMLLFENDVRLAENDLISFSEHQFGGCILDYTRLTSIVNQNTSHLKTGEDLVIKAGVGSYTTACMPKYKIGKVYVDMDEYGVGI